jgi:hypothetical protein
MPFASVLARATMMCRGGQPAGRLDAEATGALATALPAVGALATAVVEVRPAALVAPPNPPKPPNMP